MTLLNNGEGTYIEEANSPSSDSFDFTWSFDAARQTVTITDKDSDSMSFHSILANENIIFGLWIEEDGSDDEIMIMTRL